MPSFCEELAGGTVGGVLGMALVYPLDTIKSRMQTSGQSRYPSMIHVLTSMARTDGVFSLYRGLLSPVVGAGALFAITFSSYGFAGRAQLSRRGGRDMDQLTPMEMGLAGAWAGIMNGPLRQVIERVKSVMQVREGDRSKPPYPWSGACVADLVRREGIAMGLFRGMGTTMIREPVQFGVYYPTYAITKDFLTRLDRAGQPFIHETAVQMLAGGVAGCAMWVPPFYFIDVLKTRMQTAEPGVYESIRDCAVKTWRAEGSSVYFRGLGPALLRAFPLHGLVFVGYETTISFLNNRKLSNTSSVVYEIGETK
ncbi:unnamed protein product [Ascophyllum nodosum]